MDDFKINDLSIRSRSSFANDQEFIDYYKTKTPNERLQVDCLLINEVYNVTAETKVDRTIVSSRKFK